MKLRPINDRVIVRRIAEDSMTKGGIVLPDTAKEKPIEGEVVGVGNGKLLENGQRSSMTVKPGDKVLFGKYAGTEIKRDGEELVVLREEELLATIED
jgi:chaperonin GroES